MNSRINQAIIAIKSGDKQAAIRILTAELNYNSQSLKAWLILGHITETKERQLQCIKQALRIDPENMLAKKRFQQLNGSHSLTLSSDPPTNFAGPSPILKEHNTELTSNREQLVKTILDELRILGGEAHYQPISNRVSQALSTEVSAETVLHILNTESELFESLDSGGIFRLVESSNKKSRPKEKSAETIKPNQQTRVVVREEDIVQAATDVLTEQGESTDHRIIAKKTNRKLKTHFSEDFIYHVLRKHGGRFSIQPDNTIQLTLPKKHTKPDKLNLDQLVSSWLSCLSYRQRKIIQLHYLDPKPLSLDAVSRVVLETREKVIKDRDLAFEKLLSPIHCQAIMPVLNVLDINSDFQTNQAKINERFVYQKVQPIQLLSLLNFLNAISKTHEKDHEESALASHLVHRSASKVKSESRRNYESRKFPKTDDTRDEKSAIQVFKESKQIDLGVLKKDLGSRIYNALKKNNINTIVQLSSITDNDLLSIHGIGENSCSKINEALSSYLEKNPNTLEKTPTKQKLKQLNGTDLAEIKHLLGSRIYNALIKNNISTINELAELSNEDLLDCRGIGPDSCEVIHQALLPYLDKNIQSLQLTNTKVNTDQLGTTPFLQEEHNQSSPSIIKAELLAKVGTVPVDKISIERLGLSPIINIGLNRQGIETIGQLLQGVDNFVKDSAIVEPLNNYLTWLNAQDKTAWVNEIANVGISPLFQLVLAETTIEAMINEWLGNLTKRQQKIIDGRFALQGEGLTLQELGDQLDVTRERVRQIQKKAVQAVKYRYRRRRKNQLKPMIAFLHRAFVEHGGILNHLEITALFESNGVVQLGKIDPIGVFLLICEIDSQFHYFKKQQFATLSKYSIDAIETVQASFIEILKEKLTPVSSDVLLREFKETEIYASYEGWQTDYPDEFFMACLRVHPDIEQLISGLYIMANRSKKRLGAIVSALRKIGKPAHFSIIAEKTNESLPPDQQFSVRDVHSWLGRYSDVFVWVRLRGTYGLKEWGLELDLSYADACTQILENEGYPLTSDQILARMPEVRQFFDESSVLITLGTHERFYSFSNNRYGLVKWTTAQSETDFVDLFGDQLARRQAELDRQNSNVEIDTQKEVDTIRKLGLDFFSD